MTTKDEITKKFVNDSKSVVDDALRGLTAYNSNITILKTCPRVIIQQKDCEKNNEKLPHFDQEPKNPDVQNITRKVAVITGGGSGHEPFAVGYVGRGMLTAAIAGNIFASPPSRFITDALEGTKSEAGTLLVIMNYTGDRLNFGLSAERFKAKGNDIKIITVADDIAIDTSKTRTGSRGLAGTVLIIKIAGALSEQGSNLSEIESTLEEIVQHMSELIRLTDNVLLGTIGCSLSPCSIPGKGPLLTIPANQYEVGLGIHGEAGKERVELQSAHSIVNRLMKQVLPSPNKDREYVVMLNNLGSTCTIEMELLKGEILQFCAENNINVVRFYYGTFMTSLDNHGFSITVLEVPNPKLIELLDAPAECPGWKMGAVIKPNFECSIKTDASMHKQMEHEQESIEETESECPKLRKIVSMLCKEMNSREDELNKLDGAAGDGDCGTTFKTAADAIEEKYKKGQLHFRDLKKLLEQVALVFEDNVGGTSGAIYALFLSVFAQEVDEKWEAKTLVKALKSATEAVEKYGGARAGDRTMAAEGGAKNTAKMRAAAGRASYTSSDVQTEPDAGAMALSYWMRAIWDCFK